MNQVEDPGWRPAFGGVLTALVPTKGARMAARASDGLLLLRQLWLSFFFAITVLWVPVLLLSRTDALSSSVDGRVVAGVVAFAGVVGQLVAGQVVPAVQGTTDESVRSSFQRWFLLRVAFGELGALLGFAGFVLSANPGVYLVGYMVTLAGLLDAAPTAARIERMQAALRASGSEVCLLAALVVGGITR